MRRKAWINGLTAMLALVSGCKQQVFLSDYDYNSYRDLNLMPGKLEDTPKATDMPTIGPVGAPPTVNDPERKPRYITLAECIAIALEQGTVGNQTAPLVNSTGNFIAVDTTASGGGTTFSDNIRVFALQPAIQGAQIESALSKYDTLYTSSLSWNNVDQPIGTALQTAQTLGTNISAQTTQTANFTTGLLKPLVTGGVAGITFNTQYNITNLPNRLNPNYQPALTFSFEQPLIRFFGTEINELLPNHPGSIVQPGIIGQNETFPLTGTLITRVRFDQQRAEFERLVATMICNVELAYWNLYNGYWSLYANEAGMRSAFEAWKISKAKYDAGRVTIADLSQTRGQYEMFRDQRISALDQLLESERQLRGMLGMPPGDCTNLVPADEPTLAAYTPDWCTSLQEAIDLRPELFIARQDVKAAQMNVILARNALLPDLRFTSDYNLNGIGTRLDGSAPNNALQNMASDHFNTWDLGLRFTVPIGFRNAQANLRVARLQLAQTYQALRDDELKTQRLLEAQWRKIMTNYEQIRTRRAEREAYGEQLRARFQEFLAGRGTLDILLEAQRFWSTALASEYSSITAYNQAIATFEFAKGTMLRHDNVVISEGALPCIAQERAVEHQHERTNALILHERAKLLEQPPVKDPGQDLVPKVPATPSLPNLLETTKPLPDAPFTDSNSMPLGGAGKAPAVLPSDAQLASTDSSGMPAKRKPDPKKPSDFGLTRTAADNHPEIAKPTDPAQATTVKPEVAKSAPTPSSVPVPLPLPLVTPLRVDSPLATTGKADAAGGTSQPISVPVPPTMPVIAGTRSESPAVPTIPEAAKVVPTTISVPVPPSIPSVAGTKSDLPSAPATSEAAKSAPPTISMPRTPGTPISLDDLPPLPASTAPNLGSK